MEYLTGIVTALVPTAVIGSLVYIPISVRGEIRETLREASSNPRVPFTAAIEVGDRLRISKEGTSPVRNRPPISRWYNWRSMGEQIDQYSPGDDLEVSEVLVFPHLLGQERWIRVRPFDLATQEDREGWIYAGYEGGASLGFERLSAIERD